MQEPNYQVYIHIIKNVLLPLAFDKVDNYLVWWSYWCFVNIVVDVGTNYMEAKLKLRC